MFYVLHCSNKNSKSISVILLLHQLILEIYIIFKNQKYNVIYEI